MQDDSQPTGHVFISYVRENSRNVDELQRALESAGIRVWRDTAELWPGENWRAKIRKAIINNALVFIACFSRESVTRTKTYQNEELNLAIEEMRMRPPNESWLIPVRLNDCEIPDWHIGGGRTLTSIQWADLFGPDANDGVARLVATVLRMLGEYPELTRVADTAFTSPSKVMEPQRSGEVRSRSGYTRAGRILAALRADIDLMEDNIIAIEESARLEFTSADDSFRVALIELLAAEVDDETDNLLGRRLRLYGRTFAGEFAASGKKIDWDELLKVFPNGSTVLFSQPQVYSVLGLRERRRVLSGLVGNAEVLKTPSVIAWRCLLSIMRKNILTEPEATRVQEAQLRTAYPVLDEAGMTLSELMPKLVEGLDSGDYHAQNRAAHFLMASENLQKDAAALSPRARGKLAYLLLKAASGGSFGAIDATARDRMTKWSTDMLAGALWMCLTRGRDRLDTPLDRLNDVLVAASNAGRLEQVFSVVEQSNWATDLAPVSDRAADEDREWLLHHGKNLPGNMKAQWNAFLTRLLASVPRNAKLTQEAPDRWEIDFRRGGA